jgi:hypothetical protein
VTRVVPVGLRVPAAPSLPPGFLAALLAGGCIVVALAALVHDRRPASAAVIRRLDLVGRARD